MTATPVENVKDEVKKLLANSHDKFDEVFARGDLNEINMVAKKWGSMMELASKISVTGA